MSGKFNDTSQSILSLAAAVNRRVENGAGARRHADSRIKRVLSRRVEYAQFPQSLRARKFIPRGQQDAGPVLDTWREFRYLLKRFK
jgi:hypothetical protein